MRNGCLERTTFRFPLFLVQLRSDKPLKIFDLFCLRFIEGLLWPFICKPTGKESRV